MRQHSRTDKRGRRIGYNWWRDYNCSMLLDATLVWERKCEEVAIGYDTEIAEFTQQNPRPNLKDFLVRNAGIADMV